MLLEDPLDIRDSGRANVNPLRFLHGRFAGDNRMKPTRRFYSIRSLLLCYYGYLRETRFPLVSRSQTKYSVSFFDGGRDDTSYMPHKSKEWLMT